MEHMTVSASPVGNTGKITAYYINLMLVEVAGPFYLTLGWRDSHKCCNLDSEVQVDMQESENLSCPYSSHTGDKSFLERGI